MDSFVQPEILDDNNKYFCSNCHRPCKAHKGLKFVSFPYIISLQLKRFDFDYKTMSRFKLSNKVTFPEILNVSKYLSENEPKEEAACGEKSTQIDVDEIKQESNSEESGDLNTYELFSIMIHSGSATGGHYYAYIKCFDTGQWINFNDERVSKLEREDIKKAFGTSFSTYSSTTAYMLLYRQINPKRNESVMKVDEFDLHLTELLAKEKRQEIEADRLREYMENVCKVKVIVPSLAPSTGDINTEHLSRQQEKTVEIHKDLTLEQAKFEILKEFELVDYMKETRQKCRILKYETYNELIDQSYRDENTTTVFEALGFTKFPYGMCWYLDVLFEEDEFLTYNHNDYSIKVVNLNTTTFETDDLFTLRVNNESSVYDLREAIAKVKIYF